MLEVKRDFLLTLEIYLGVGYISFEHTIVLDLIFEFRKALMCYQGDFDKLLIRL